MPIALQWMIVKIQLYAAIIVYVMRDVVFKVRNRIHHVFCKPVGGKTPATAVIGILAKIAKFRKRQLCF